MVKEGSTNNVAGDSASITDWDIWMLRYTCSQLKSDTSRFPEIKTPVVTPPEEDKLFTNTLEQSIIIDTAAVAYSRAPYYV